MPAQNPAFPETIVASREIPAQRIDAAIPMIRPRERPPRHDVLTIPVIWAALLLSLLVHLAALWFVVPILRNRLVSSAGSASTTPLAVRLADAPTPPPPRAAMPPPPAAQAAVPPARMKTPARKVTPTHREPPVVAIEKPAPRAIGTTPVPSPEPGSKPVPPPPAEDLAAYIESRRRARGEAPAPVAQPAASDAGESDIERRNRIVADNLGLNRTPTFGRNAMNAGGIFEITEMSLDNAAFWFFGFDKDIGRNAKQLIEVRKGQNSGIRIAVVRRMIGIIREKISGDFQWASQRLGREVTLSARPADNEGLEDFILHDVFPDARLQ